MLHAIRGRDDRGQVLIIVSFAFVGLLAMLALLFDAANGLVLRRQLQDAGDAAALAGANVMQVGSPRGCGVTAGSTTPRTAIVDAVKASLAQNAPWYDANTAVVSCPGGKFQNQAVAVDLATDAPRFFAGIVGGELHVTSRSAAINGQLTTTNYSIVQLDPGNPSWPNGRRGCPSVLLSGGPTVTLDASMQINSACTAANGGALATNGNAATLTMNNNGKIRVVGDYVPSALTISPPPTTGVQPVPDPLAGLPPISQVGMPIQSNSRMVLNNTVAILRPGVYKGGIELRNSAVALLEPGIYVLAGGGLQVGAQGKVYSVSSGVTLPPTDWGADCPVASCGVLLFNTSGSPTAMGQIQVAAGATMKLRAYNPDAQGGGVPEYDNLLIWQDADPIPTSSYAQPVLLLRGGGTVDISGTVYAPSALVRMGGSSGGSGGDPVNLTLQFISWDLEIFGNSQFHFFFQDEEFARPTDYGLVE